MDFRKRNAVFINQLIKTAFMLKNQDKLLLIFALLVGNAAGSLASRLAGGLALAATTVLNSSVDILGFDCLDSAHF
jgi:hypothetical protein